MVWLGNNDNYCLIGGFLENSNMFTALILMEYTASSYSEKWQALIDYSDNSNPNSVAFLHAPSSEQYVFGCINQHGLPSGSDQRFFVAQINTDKTLNTITTVNHAGSGSTKTSCHGAYGDDN